MARDLDHHREQQRAILDGFDTANWMGGPTAPTPPVLDEGSGTRSRMTAIEILRGEARESPLILQFIKAVLAITAFPRHLGNRLRGKVSSGHQQGVLPHPDRIQDLMIGKVRTQLTMVVHRLPGNPFAYPTMHNHHPS
ncbi:hypothetical protein [Orrella marina]|uniref:Uncharacterized protein n=1 Tax=Orrella marina TaxID=2163011 RepID=A0A2R4XJT1_9BURK|nr:hypothetical protein [Orrella marina]AWB34024.1 hypothetical protein DBV39_10200 [Orrella marina]